MNILVVEDNSRISDFVVKGLTEYGYTTTLCEDGKSARELLTQPWDVIILDIMLPDIDGINLVQYARFKKISTPILIISALGELDDKVKALNSGADDYLVKPFHFKELVARINALSRRSKGNIIKNQNILEVKNITLDPDRHQVHKDGEEIKLTLIEFKLLRLLMENVDRVVLRVEIMKSVWGTQYDTNTNVVDVYISYLRNKIEDNKTNRIIETVKGIGYIIREN